MTYTAQGAPAVNLLYPGISGAGISNNATTPNTSLDISAGIMRDQSDTFDINLGNVGGVYANISANATTTIDATKTGVNGLDTGTLGASSLYSVYAIGDYLGFNQAAAVISLNAVSTGPVLPKGYNIYRLIGYIRTDGSSHFLLGYWYGAGNARSFAYAAPFQVGSSLTATAKTTISLSNVVPNESGLQVVVNASITPATAGNSLTLYPYNAASSQAIITGQVSAVAMRQQTIITALLNSGVAALSYTVSNGSDSGNVFVYGYFYTV